MTSDSTERLLRLRIPVSTTVARDYAIPVLVLVAALLGLLVFAGIPLSATLTLLGLFSAMTFGALLAGLVVYNIAVPAFTLLRR